MSAGCVLKTESYEDQRCRVWPRTGRHILAQYDEECIVVYQAFCPEIAEYAVKHGKFGGPVYSFTRMTWVKTNFLWMMYRSGWGRKRNQERTLAIYLTREGFDTILRGAKGAGIPLDRHLPDDVRIQWDPDHSPKGGKLERRAIQLGLRGATLQRFHDQYIRRIEDISEFVEHQWQFVLNDQLDKLLTPVERQYIPEDEEVCRHILLDGFDDCERKSKTERLCDALAQIEANSDDIDGACCEELLNSVMQRATDGAEKDDVIVCLGGAFNPVHTRHVEVLEAAIQWLEKNTRYHAVAGRLAVAPDGYVKTKCKRSKELCMKAEHRIKLCELTCEGHTLIKPYRRTVGSAMDCGEKMKREENWPHAKVAVIMGADRAMSRTGHKKWNTQTKCVTVCVGRRGTTEAVKQAYLEDYKLDLVTNKDFYIVDTELDNVSSTKIRKCLRQEDGFNFETDDRNVNCAKSTQGIIDEVRVIESACINNMPTYMCTIENSMVSSESEHSDNNSLETRLPVADSDAVAVRKRVDDLVTKGWITHSAGQYILENFSDLYL